MEKTATLTIHGPLERGDLPGLIGRTCALFERVDFDVLRCELSGVAADAVAVDALARLALVAQRQGRAIRLCNASPQLHALVAFMGLDGVLRE